jgi:hypothetical protein
MSKEGEVKRKDNAETQRAQRDAEKRSWVAEFEVEVLRLPSPFAKGAQGKLGRLKMTLVG